MSRKFRYEGGDAARYAAVGRFIFECSGIEVTAHLTLRDALGIPDALARALIGQPGLVELMELFKKSATASEASIEYHDHLAMITKEVKYINSIRQIVAHKRLMSAGASGLVFHDGHTAKIRANAFQYRCTVEELDACSLYADSVGDAVSTLRDFSGKCLAPELPSRNGLTLLPAHPDTVRPAPAERRRRP